MIIQYLNSQRKYKVAPLKNIIEKAIITALREEKINEFLVKNSTNPVFSITFTNNENIRKINKAYRNLDKPTDVLSFPMFEDVGYDANDNDFTKAELDSFTKSIINSDEKHINLDNSDCPEMLNTKRKLSNKILTRIPPNQIFITSKNTKEANFGDIVISLEKAFEQSQEYGHSFEREVAFLTVHSVLHLLGYDHIDAKDEKKMIKRQKQIMAGIEKDQ